MWPPQLQYRSMCGVQTQRPPPIAFDLYSLRYAYPQIRVCSDCSVVMGLQETLTMLVLLFLSLCLFICFFSLSLSMAKVYLPKSRGTLWLNSRNVSDNPVVRYNYYSDPDDVATCVSGAKRLQAIINSTAFASFRFTSVPLPLL